MNQTNILKFFSKTGSPKIGSKRLSLSSDCDSTPKKPKSEDSEVSEKKSPMADATNVLNQSNSSIDFEDKRIVAKLKLMKKSSEGLVTNFSPSWFKVLESEFDKEYFKNLSKVVTCERMKGTVYPTEDNVFSWTQMCDFRSVKVVILGQDPYHGPNQAHGLCFSVLRPTPPPPSLINMYKELENDIDGFKTPSHGDLSGWARQGVLLLNAVLTVKAHQANSHKDKGWEQFTDAVIRVLSQQRKNLVFILWGAYAQKKGARIDKSKHKILSGPHPSPLSAHRGFFGCGHFFATNRYLEQCGKTPINWTDLP